MRVRLGDTAVEAGRVARVSCFGDSRYLNVTVEGHGIDMVSRNICKDALPACRDFLIDWGFATEVERFENGN